MFNTNINNQSFGDNTVQMVWEKGNTIIGKDRNLYRKDSCGATMYRNDYGNTNSDSGWEIDHIIPKSKGGNDDLLNLQPLQWANNRHKSGSYPNWACKISA